MSIKKLETNITQSTIPEEIEVLKSLLDETTHKMVGDQIFKKIQTLVTLCLLYTSDAADDMQCVDLGGRRIIKKKRQGKSCSQMSLKFLYQHACQIGIIRIA